MEVTFFLPGESDLAPLEQIDPDADAQPLQRGERAWVLQTYLRLRRAGYAVQLTEEPLGGSVVVFHVKHRRELVRQRGRLRGSILVGIRADNREAAIADLEVLQNGRFADGRRRFFIPHWPQPGLRPRDERRGTAVRVVAFKGFAANLHPAFRSAEWSGFLAALDVTWEVHAGAFAGVRTDEMDLNWSDYTAVDVVLAVRPGRGLHTSKPATKLYNAWHAGVPALLGAEHAYRELRRSPLDYIEVASLGDAKAALQRLVNEPGLYRAMVDNGRTRATELTHPAIVERWGRLLFETVPALAASPRGRLLRALPLSVKVPLRRLLRLLALRPAR